MALGVLRGRAGPRVRPAGACVPRRPGGGRGQPGIRRAVGAGDGGVAAEWSGPIPLGNGTRGVRVLVPDATAALKRAVDAGTDVYWCELWASAYPVAQALHGSPPRVDVRGKSVVDVGCGLGLAGVSAVAAGASRVVFVDQVADAVALAVRSALAVAAEAEGPGGSAPAIAGGVLDWSDLAVWPAHAYEVATLADVLYEETAVDALADLLGHILVPEGAVAVVADQAKRTPRNRERFVARMRAAGFSVTDESVVWTEADASVLSRVWGFANPADDAGRGTPPPTIHLLVCGR